MRGDRIELRGIPVYAYVGVLPEEREKGQTFYLDLVLEQGYSRASESDCLEHTVNYAACAERAKHVAEHSRRQLIEALAEDLAEDLLLHFPRLLEVEVIIHKPSAPIPLTFSDVVLSLRRSRWEEAVLSLGANLGNRSEALRLAARRLEQTEGIRHFRLSSFYENPAWGKEDQPSFLNAVAMFETSLSPWELLRLCQRLEQEAGRVRREHWGPRSLDLDIISYGGFRSSDPELLLPHPYAAERRFVQLPLRELRDLQPRIPRNEKENSMSDSMRAVADRALLVVDCQHDFVDGSLACAHAAEGIDAMIQWINSQPELSVYYSADWHGPDNQSFIRNGGTWPEHCVAGTRGAEIVPDFAERLCCDFQKPGTATLFYKGRRDEVEEYSAFEARREDGQALKELLPKDVFVAGIASEFCVRESCLALARAGFDVTLLAPMLGWVQEDKHEKNLMDLAVRGIRVLRNGKEIE